MSDAGRTEAAAKAIFEDQSPYHWDDHDLPDDIRTVWRQEADVALAAADGYDREHGIVRVDTRDAATLHLVAAALLEAPDGDDDVEDLTEAAQAVLRALSVGAPQGEAQ
jgi:hypothetical protein